MEYDEDGLPPIPTQFEQDLLWDQLMSSDRRAKEMRSRCSDPPPLDPKFRARIPIVKRPYQDDERVDTTPKNPPHPRIVQGGLCNQK